MSSKLQQGKLKKTSDGAHQAFARSVRKNLHVFVVWNIDNRTGSPFGTIHVQDQDFVVEQ